MTRCATHQLGELEWTYLDLLALGRRLNWIQLGELLRLTNDTQTVSEFAHLAQVAPDQLPLLYAAALFTGSADSVERYLLAYGKAGAEDLRLALGLGQGAVRAAAAPPGAGQPGADRPARFLRARSRCCTRGSRWWPNTSAISSAPSSSCAAWTAGCLPRCGGPPGGRVKPGCCRACKAAPSRCSLPS